jgi:hypothetical protein
VLGRLDDRRHHHHSGGEQKKEPVGVTQPAHMQNESIAHLRPRTQAGELVHRNADRSTEGRDPRRLGRDQLAAAGHHAAPILKVIRAKCLHCSYGQPSEIAKCTAVGCALWPHRIGTNPFSNRTAQPAHILKKPIAGIGETRRQRAF